MAEGIYLLGAGGHGRVVLNSLLNSGFHVTGILDSELKAGNQVFGISILGDDEFLETVPIRDVLLVNGLGANPGTINRQRLFSEKIEKGFSFMTFQHSSAIIGKECKFGEGSQVMAGAVVQCGVTIGTNAVINTHASIDHDCFVEEHAFISPGATLCGQVCVGISSFIGPGSVILPGIQIGKRAIVKAGSVVTRSVSENCVVAGNPALKIRINSNG